MSIPRNKRGSWLVEGEKPKPRPKTMKVVCAACTEHYYHTVTALPWDYKRELEQTECLRCGVKGRLATSELAKTKVKRDSKSQLALNFYPVPLGKRPRG